MNDDQLREALHGSLDTLTPATRSLDPVRTAGRRRRRLRESALAVAAVVVLGGSAVALVDLGDDRSALQPADPSPSASATTATPEQAWDAFLADHPGAPHSDVLTTANGSYAAYADGPTTHVMQFGGQSWQDLWADDATGPVDVTTVSLTQLTGGLVPDVVVGTSAAGVVPTSVLRSDGHAWVPVPFFGCGGPSCADNVVEQVPDGRVVDGLFVSTYNACTPTCASSPTSEVTWTWHPSFSRFEPAVRSGACAPGSAAVVWDVTDAVLVNGLVQVTYQVDAVRCGTVDDVIYEPTGSTMHATLATDAHVEVLPPNGSPNPTVITPDELPQQLLPGTHHTFQVTVSGGSVSSLVEQYHP